MKIIQDLPGRERFDLLGSKGSFKSHLLDRQRPMFEQRRVLTFFDSDDLISEN